MKIAMESYVVCDTHGEEKGLEMIKNAGFEAVDYHFASLKSREQLAGNYMEKAAKTKEILERIGLPCVQSHAPFVFRYEMGDWRGHPLWEETRRGIEYAAYLGAKQTIIHTINVPEGVDFYAYNVEFLKSFEPAAKEYGIRIGVENGEDPGFVNKMIELLDSPWFVICVDVGHANAPDHGCFAENFLRALEKPEKLQALHLNSNFGVYGHTTDIHYIPYLCHMNWDEIIKALAEMKYSGDFTMEICGILQELPPEVHPETLALASAVGRHMVRKFKEFS